MRDRLPHLPTHRIMRRLRHFLPAAFLKKIVESHARGEDTSDKIRTTDKMKEEVQKRADAAPPSSPTRTKRPQARSRMLQKIKIVFFRRHPQVTITTI